MTERPIIFSAPMVRAILAGRKTQTRRILKLPKKTASGGPIYERPDMGGWEPTTVGGGGSFRFGAGGERIAVPEQPAIWHRTTGVCITIPFADGDQLWIRETCAAVESARGYAGVKYAADQAWVAIANTMEAGDQWSELYQYRGVFGAKVPPIHMPRWASRLTLKVTGVKVERLQGISEADAKAEGVKEQGGQFAGVFTVEGAISGTTAVACFQRLWESINGPGSWDANPWVAAISFERVPPSRTGEER